MKFRHLLAQEGWDPLDLGIDEDEFSPEAYRAEGYSVAPRELFCGEPDATEARLMKAYALTLGEYNEMLQAQQGRCKICKRDGNGSKRLAVDHCHRTGRIRGLLCSRCNLGIGYFKDRPDLLEAAAEYVRKARS